MGARPSKEELVGVILAAGKGTRMAPLPTPLPKPLLPVMGKPILQHQLELMKQYGIRRVFIVVNHQGVEIVRHLERSANPELTIDYIEQPEPLGTAHAVATLRDCIDSPFLLLLGDIFFHQLKLDQAIAKLQEGDAQAVLLSNEETNRERMSRNFCIVADEATGDVQRVMEKPTLPLSSVKGIGAYLFRPTFFDAVRRTPRTAMRNEYEITDSIQLFIDNGHRVTTSSCVTVDTNVTFPADLLDVNLLMLRDAEQENFVLSPKLVSDTASLSEVIAGEGVKIGNGCKLRQCVLFPDVVIPGGMNISRAIVSPEGICPVSPSLGDEQS